MSNRYSVVYETPTFSNKHYFDTLQEALADQSVPRHKYDEATSTIDRCGAWIANTGTYQGSPFVATIYPPKPEAEEVEDFLGLDPEGDDEDVYGEGADGRAHPSEPDDDEVLCPICGGYGGESYGSDYGTCGECGGSGVVGEGWGKHEADECPDCGADVEDCAVCPGCGRIMGMDDDE
ncbi:hypothetical protein Q5H93_02910 [Hymenobacter sp. ASUV-10]|uniref:Zinc ribbon domain-containing protein n=1 Tax=Hymenobacter aranciens TaxID=3063996 RepID=A0ABT9B7I9_9BACT|nr:hypothetical protein [Hymenobacter sp. ASUV-10]MDO7873669.1 hypothetical protein [Hymenobacter sp. ASUV-10]